MPVALINPRRLGRSPLPALLLPLASMLAPLAFGCGGESPSEARADAGFVDGSGADVPAACAPPRALCSGERCVDLQTDDQACGTCDTVCGDRESCNEGTCVCAEGRERCGRACVDLSSDASHCGACGSSCASGEVCNEGTCELVCAPGLTVCGSACVDLATDLSHCGACDRACQPGFNASAACEEGACSVACNPDYYDLDDQRGCETFCAPSAPGIEVCDGEDNDCDGLLDEADPDWVAPLCDGAVGVCAEATQRCTAGRLSGCTAADYEAAAVRAGRVWSADEALCDGDDNDCDGVVDEGCCGRERVISVPEFNDPLRDDWRVYRSANVQVDGALLTTFAGDRADGSYPTVRVGRLEVDAEGEVTPTAVAGERNQRPYFGVLPGPTPETLEWWLATETGVRVGVTTTEIEPLGLFGPAPAELGLPITELAGVSIDRALQAVSAIAAQDGLVQRVSGIDTLGGWTSVLTNEFTDILEPTVFASDEGVRACAMVVDGFERTIRCWLFDDAMRLDDEVVLFDAPTQSFPSPALPWGDGVAFHAASGDVGCEADCDESVYRVELRRDGGIETVNTGLDARNGLAHAWHVDDGERWLFVASDVDSTTGRVTYDLHRSTATGFELVATFTGALPLAPAALIVGDERVTAVLRAPNGGRSIPALVTYAFTRDGVALCGPNLAEE